MTRFLLHAVMAVSIYLVIIPIGPGDRAFAAGEDNCLCHAATRSGKAFVHQPVKDGECLSCHKQTGKKHPRFKKEAFTLTDKGNAGLCYECHERKNTMKFVHAPVASGECRECHNVHQSGAKYQLAASGGALCFKCHDKTGFERTYRHGPVAGGNCIACHDPHQSNLKYMLKGEPSSLCLTCHAAMRFSGVSTHAPVASGNCMACHAPHSTVNRHLLKQSFSEEFYLPFAKENYALCFTCHKNDIADDQRTGVQTGFRNGLRNLHFVHVNNAEKGRSCRLCHAPHASVQDHLISRNVKGFGSWFIPIRYTRTPTGGTCVVGCHKPKSYDWRDAVENP